ncbi:MAG: ParA family protein, partial [Nitrospiraceae bacterium]|nr:ParA family protein [Nitrospiraceae bacterium]
MGKIIAITNQKGGVGKTTTALNLSSSLALANEDILVIDSDPQGNLTSGFGIKKEGMKAGLYEVYSGKVPIDEAIQQTLIPNLYILPTSMDLFAAEIELLERPERENLLKMLLKPFKEKFRYIFIDCPPSFGLLTLNALVAAESVLVPVQCEYFAMEGLSILIKLLWRIRGGFNETLDMEGILLTMYNRHLALSRQISDDVRRIFKSKVYDTVIPRNVILAESPSHGKPAVLYAPNSSGAQGYIALAKEILNENNLLF